jgi:tRNA-2-methylthio-N6-dimethylallyladenosine synthase
VHAMERGKYDVAFVARYSPRPGAVSEKRFPDDVSAEEKKNRDIAITEVLKKTACENNEKLNKTTIPVLVEGPSRKEGKMLGRTEGLKSVEFDSTDEALVGQFVNIDITNVDSWRLYGNLLDGSNITAMPLDQLSYSPSNPN